MTTTPLGHTSFSWNASTTPPLAHTSYSWGQSISISPPTNPSPPTTTSTSSLPLPPINNITLVDADCNFLHEDLQPHLLHHIQRATQSQPFPVTQFITPCVCLRDLNKALQLGIDHPNVIFVTAGVHPFWSAATVNALPREGGCDFTEQAMDQLADMAANDTFRCIGECGLDLVRPPTHPKGNGFPCLATQLPWFQAQVSLAVNLKKPLFLHERKAHQAFLEVLDPYLDLNAKGIPGKERRLPPCLVHAFTGTENELKAYRQRDFYIGITGFILEKTASAELRQCLATLVPLHRLMVETDAPYMGFKGCRDGEEKEFQIDGKIYKNRKKDKYPNVPASLSKIVVAIADIYNVSPEDIAMATSDNARRFFDLRREKETGGNGGEEYGNRDQQGDVTVEGESKEQVVQVQAISTTLSILQDLETANALQDQGLLQEAEVLFKKVLLAREATLGKEDPETLTVAWNLGTNLQDQGKLGEAEPMLKRALNGYDKILGHEHQDTLVAAYGFADFLETKEDFEEAAIYSWWSLKGFVGMKSRNDVADGVEQLCALLELQGKIEEADAIEERFANFGE